MPQKTNRILIFAFPIILALTLTWSSTAMCEVIHEAVKNNNLPEVTRLIENDPNLVFSKDENGFTPLHLAAANGYRGMVDFLLTTKADVNARDDSGSTPLHQAAAAEGEHSDIVEVLLGHKANVDAADQQGLTPLHYALLADNPDVAMTLLRHRANPDAFDLVEAGDGVADVAGVGHGLLALLGEGEGGVGQVGLVVAG